MRELPLLACDSVALNLRSGRQTQHRVPMRPRPVMAGAPPGAWLWRRRPTAESYVWYSDAEFRAGVQKYAPWQPGDTLYVRECHQRAHCLQHDETLPTLPCRCHETLYRADPSWSPAYGGWERVKPGCDGRTLERIERWRPSIHMPKNRARTWLKVTRSWAERVQDISEEDARAEGVGLVMADALPEKERRELTNALRRSRRNGFRWMWERLYPGSWERNDWLWCCELELDRERSGVTYG